MLLQEWADRCSFHRQQSPVYQKMANARASTTICHLILAGSSVWTCRLLYKAGHIQWAYGTLGLYFAKSCIGALRYGRSSGYRIMSWYNYMELFCTALAVPLIASDLYMLMGYSSSLSVVHAISGLLPFIGIIIGSLSQVSYCISIVVLGNLFSVFFGGLWNSNFWAVAAAISYTIDIYGIKSQGTVGSVPSIDLNLISLCFFNYFMYKALTDSSLPFEVLH